MIEQNAKPEEHSESGSSVVISTVTDSVEWTSTKDRLPQYGEIVLAIIQHFHTKRSKHVVLETVEEDDYFWKFDGCEMSHDWDCIYWIEIPDDPK